MTTLCLKTNVQQKVHYWGYRVALCISIYQEGLHITPKMLRNISTIHSYNQLLIKDMLSCFQAPYMASAQKNWTKQMDRTLCLKIYILLPRLNVKEERCKQPYYSMYVCASKVKAAMQQCIAQCGYN